MFSFKPKSIFILNAFVFSVLLPNIVIILHLRCKTVFIFKLLKSDTAKKEDLEESEEVIYKCFCKVLMCFNITNSFILKYFILLIITHKFNINFYKFTHILNYFN